MDSIGATGVDRRLEAAHRRLNAAMVELFATVVEAEAAEVYLGRYQDATAWLRWSCGVSGRTARRWVRVARALDGLPRLREALASGAVSVDQIELLVRVATPDNQAELLEVAAHHDLEELRREVKELERQAADTEEPEREPLWVDRAPRARTWWRDDVLHIEGTVPGADGVLVETALLRLAAKAPRDEQSGLGREHEIRTGEALIQMASESLASDGDHDRATLVVHVNAHELMRGDATGWDAMARLFDPVDVARLACDARLQPAIDDPHGVTVGVGRTTRSIAGWLRRLVEGRDQGCRFPGCDRTRWLHAHHLTPWAEGGPTNLDNLVSLCGYHHRLIHRDRWTITGNPNQALVFHNKWGEVHRPVKGPFPPNWHQLHLKHLEQYRTTKLHELNQHALTRAGPP